MLRLTSSLLQVVMQLEDVALSGPCKSAGHAVRAHVLLPQAAQQPALEHFYGKLVSAMRAPAASSQLNSVNIVHGMAQLLHSAPDVSASSAMHLIEFALDGVLKSDALFGSLDAPSTANLPKSAVCSTIVAIDTCMTLSMRDISAVVGVVPSLVVSALHV